MSYTSSSADRADVYTRITAEIVAAIEAGAGEWRMPWHHDGTAITRPQNVSSGNRYRGVNVLALWIAAQAHGYADGLWGTYRQWLAIGAQVRKGERGTTVVLWKQAKPAANDDARLLIDGGYRLKSVVPVDQFRHTPHVELVAKFER